jgi:hypothetical protein
MEFDLSFLDDNSKEIKGLLFAFCHRYERLTTEKQEATKEWLDKLVALQETPPVSGFAPRILLRTLFSVGDPEEGDFLPWSFPADLLIKAIRAVEQKLKYHIQFEDLLMWDR